MLQILQSLPNGRASLAEVPCPQIGTGQLLIRSRISLMSAGTERILLEFGKAKWLQKAGQQSGKFRMSLEMY